MSERRAATPSRQGTAIWLAVGLGLVVLFAGNGHLVYVAVTSQPACVDHRRAGEGGAPQEFRAAMSACSPQRGAAQK
jgi:hypothetical protein